MRSLINILDLSLEDIDELIATAQDIIENPTAYAERCKGKILGTLFFEQSLQGLHRKIGCTQIYYA